MLDEKEYAIAEQLYRQMFGLMKSGLSREESAKPLMDYYNALSGFGETEPNAILHHRVSLYGPPCGSCGKPFRTPQANLCVACGHTRLGNRKQL